MGRLLIGALVILLAIVSCQADINEKRSLYSTRNEVVLCKDKSTTPCSCYPDKSLLDCHDEIYSYRFVRNSSIKTSNPDFYPTKVNMSGNSIETFDATKFLEPEQRKAIEILDLSRNNLQITDRYTFDSFDNLKVLNLSHNNIQLFRSQYYRRYNSEREDREDRGDQYEWLSPKLAESLEVLDLSHNRITRLPFNLLSKFSKLKKLILDGNSIPYLRVRTFNMSALEELSMQGCGIDTLSDTFFSTFPRLKKLLMRNNFVRYLPELQRIPTLKYVDLSNNQIRRIYRQYSEYSIETLLLGENSLFSIEYATFSSFPNLTKLDLHGNGLYELDKTMFKDIYYSDPKPVKLQELDISDCRFQTLDENLLPWKQLKSLKIKGNNFNCDTNLGWLILDHGFPVEKGDDQPVCYRPEALRGRKFVDIKKEELNNPIETAALYYTKEVLDVITKNQQLFFFGLGAVCAVLLVISFKCFCCCLQCLCCNPLKKHYLKMDERIDRFRLMEQQSNLQEYKPQEDTQTIAETIPDEE